MYKLIVFTALLAVASAAPGLLGAPLASPWGGIGVGPVVGAPIAAPLASSWGHGLGVAPVVSAPIVRTAVPVATSYANTVRIATPSVAVAHAPLVAHGPILAGGLGHGW